MKRYIFLRPIILTFSYQSLLLLWTAIFFVTLIQLFEIYNLWAIYLLTLLLLMLDAGLTVGWMLVMRRYAKWRVRFFAFVNLYLGTGHFLVLASLGYWTLQVFNDSAELHLPTLAIGRWLILLALFISAYGVWKSYQTKIARYQIKIKNLPQAWSGKKIVMFADVHLGNIRGINFINTTVDLVKNEKPDLVLIPGDYFDGPPADLEALAVPLAKIKAKHGVFFCDGNHEEFKHNVPFVHALKKAGVVVLNNDFVEINGLQIIGVDYRSTRGVRHLRKVLKAIDFDRDKPSILMKHVPSGFKAANEAHVNLMVSGHTHMGQVFPFNLLTKILFRGYEYGLTPYKNMQVLTTVGVGTWGPPQRVGTHSEIVSIVLQ